MRYIFLITLFLAPVSFVSASEAETWKCKIHETMGIIKGPDGLMPSRFIDADYEYRILNRAALFEAVGRDKVLGWITKSEQNSVPLENGHYFYRDTSVSGKYRYHWLAMSKVGPTGVVRGNHAWFYPKTARFERHPVTLAPWVMGDVEHDYVFEFAKCTRFFD